MPTYPINGEGTLKITGHPTDSFNLTINPRDQVIDSLGITEWNDADLQYEDRTEATIDHEGDVNLQETIPLSSSNGSFENLTPTVASLTGNKLTRLSDGQAKILYRTPRLTRYASIQIRRETNQASRQFVRFKEGTLFRNMVDMLEPYMAGKTLADTSMYVNYATQNWNLNSSFWLPHLDFSCLSVWNDSGQNQMGGTLITPRHVIFNQHFQPYVGPTPLRRIRFKSWLTGEIHERVVTNGVPLGPWNYAEDSQGDIFIDELDEPLPPEIPVAKFLPPRFKNYTKCEGYFPGAGIPILACDQFKRAHVTEWMYMNFDAAHFFITPSDSLRYSLYTNVINGDSSSPGFGVIDNELVLLCTWRYAGAGAGPNYYSPTVRSKILTGLAALGSTYQIQDVDLSSFENFDLYLQLILSYDSLVGYWRLAEPGISFTPTVAIDEKAFRIGTYIGGMSLNSSPSPFAGGKNVATFDGVNDYVSIPHTGSLPTWTIEAWVKRNGPQTVNCAVVTDTYNGISLNFAIMFASSTAIQIGFYNNLWCQLPPAVTPDNTWFHVVGTYDGSVISMYYNGVLNSASEVNLASLGGGVELRIGRRWDIGDYFKGSVADVAIYNEALTPEEVLANYNQGIAA